MPLWRGLRGRRKQQEEEEEQRREEELAMALHARSIDIERDLREDSERAERRPTRRRRRRKIYGYSEPSEKGWSLINEKTILFKTLQGENFKFRAFHLERDKGVHCECLVCHKQFKGLFYKAVEPEIPGVFCSVCFNKIPDYDPFLEDWREKRTKELMK